jgi:mannose-6-phosphate isomerase-like protein (cupin superfamily)
MHGMGSDEAGAAPRLFNVLHGEALSIRETPFGRVGTLLDDTGFEVVWVEKAGEAIDPVWFSSEHSDVLLVVKGQLKVEFKERAQDECLLGPGDCLTLPPRTNCRAYRWPRDAAEATVFVAAYSV